VAQIEKALKEADAGDFASEAEVNAVMEKWLDNAR
jgi:predicted transcriptional regulator